MDFVLQALPILLKGAKVSFLVAIEAGILSLLIALLVGILRDMGNRPVDIAMGIYVEVFRGTSAFIQIFWVYFALPMLGIRLNALTAGVLVLALNVGAYGSEIVRSALAAVPRGQREAATAFALPSFWLYFRILIPQALIRTVLPFGNLMIDLLKGTSLLSAISVTELAFAGRQIVSAEGHAFTVFGMVMALYLIMSIPIALLARLIDARLSRWRGA